METLLQDFRYSIRTLAKQPGFALVAIFTLALGIGANTAIFSVVNAVMLRPLPYKEPERLVRVWQTSTKNPQDRNHASALNFRDWRDQNQSFDSTAAYLNRTAYNLTGAGEPERVSGSPVSASLFPMLGVEPALGRGFLEEEDHKDGNKVVILSHNLWQSRFGGDPDVLGNTLMLDNQNFMIIGVMPPDFRYPSADTALWVPIAIDFKDWGRGNFFLDVIARLKPEVTLEQAQADMDAIALRLENDYPSTNTDSRIAIVPMHEQVVSKTRPLLVVLLGAVAFVLLVACANVANLLLARAAGRRKEIAIRVALGATRMRLVRQLLSESLLLSVAGGLLGLLVALWGNRALIALTPDAFPRVEEIGIDGRVLAFTLALSLITGIVFGLIPALQASRPNLNETLKEGGRNSTTSEGFMRRGLVVVEVALALILLIGAGLMIRSFARLSEVDPGFSTEKILTAEIALPRSKYPGSTVQATFFQKLIDRVAVLPGVQATGAATALPLTRFNNWRLFYIDGRPHASARDYTGAGYRAISANYFKAMGIPVLKGRELSESDHEKSERVVIINNSFAQRFFADEDPIGKRMKMGTEPESPGPWMTVIGIVGDVKHTEIDEDAKPEIYLPYLQAPQSVMTMAIRTTGNPELFAEILRREVQAIDQDQPLAKVATIDQLIDRSMARRRFNMLLLGTFAAVALLLASLGIYGVMSYTVTQNTREIGIRMALGAQSNNVLRLVIGQGMALAVIGVAIGIAGSFGLTRLMESLLFGVAATDMVTFIAIPAILSIVALLACYLPARRATKVDPMISLRHE
jgi:putative ABC transport system permease protein